MEISPRRSLSLDFDASVASPAASSYPPTYINCQPSIYKSQETKSETDEKSSRNFGMTSSLSVDSGSETTMLVPKKENFISNIFNVLTNAVIERFAKVPSSFMNNINSTLSVTVVPNEGIISQDFFKNLTQSCEQLATENPNESPSKTEKLSSKLLQDSKSQMSYKFSDNTLADNLPEKKSQDYHETNEIDDITREKKLSSVELTCDEKEEKKDIIRHIEDSTMDNLDDKSDKIDESETSSISTEDNCTNIKKPCSSRSEKIGNFTGKKSISEGNNCSIGWQKMWRKVVNGMSDHLKPRCSSPEQEIPTKKPNLGKPRRKTCSVARARGKGRGKSQLRRSGVSQSRHRKERTKQDIYSNIQDDLENWQMSDSQDSGNEDFLQGIRENEEKQLAPCQETWKNCSTIFENFNFDDTNKSRITKQPNGNVKCPLRVRYVNESPMDVDSYESHDCIKNAENFRPRLVSESSVDSEDSYCIVFESNDSEYVDYYDDDEDEDDDDDDDSVSDEETDEDEDCDSMSDEETDDENCHDDETTLRVRFNLEPEIHTMIKWNYAYRAARKGPWEEMARDRERFRCRINGIGRILEPILSPQHRKCVWQNRFDVEG